MSRSIADNQAWPLVGNDHVSDFLSRSMVNGRVSGSYIFLGPDGLGKTTVAKFFVKSLLCQQGGAYPCGNCVSCRQMEHRGEEDDLSAVHGDYHLIKKDPAKKNISIEQIREFNKALNMSSFLNSYKTGIIKGAENLSLEASNALLKTLEEPKKKVVVVLIASNLENIPSTVVSRSQVLNFYPVSGEVIYDHLLKNYNTSRSAAKNFSRLSLGRPALAVKFLEDRDFFQDYQGKAEMFLDALSDPDANTRVQRLNEFLGERSSGQEGARRALNIIEVWRGVARDILLINSQNQDRIQHEVLREKVDQARGGFNFGKSFRLLGLLQKGEKQIESNVNPRLVLENILFNLA